MTRYKNINGVRSELTAEENTLRDAEEAEALAQQQAEKDAKVAQEAVDAQKAIDKGTGNQKLLDLGLSQAEVDALTG